jgi:hypothetical protein
MPYEIRLLDTLKEHAYKISVAQMRLLTWMTVVKQKDKIRNNHIHGNLEAASIREEITEGTI